MKYTFMKGKKYFFTSESKFICLSFSRITFKVSKAERWKFKNEEMRRVLKYWDTVADVSIFISVAVLVTVV